MNLLEEKLDRLFALYRKVSGKKQALAASYTQYYDALPDEVKERADKLMIDTQADLDQAAKVLSDNNRGLEGWPLFFVAAAFAAMTAYGIYRAGEAIEYLCLRLELEDKALTWQHEEVMAYGEARTPSPGALPWIPEPRASTQALGLGKLIVIGGIAYLAYAALTSRQ